MTASHIYKYPPRDVARCAGNPERAECGGCARRADPAQPLRQPEWWLGSWAGHGPCPDRQPRHEKESKGEQ